MRVLTSAILLLLAPVAALAVPSGATVQGFVRTSGGAPASGTYAMTFRVFTAETGGTAVFTHDAPGVVVEGGIFDVALPLPEALLLGAEPLWLEPVVEGEALPRQPLRAVPFATVAAHAADLACTGCVQAAEVAFPYAASASKGGPAADLDCTGCVEGGELAPGAIAASHLQAGAVTAQKVAFPYAASATAAGPASDVACSGCVAGGDIAPNVALGGDVSATGSLSACTAGASGCVLRVGDAALADHGDGWVGVQVADGLRVRDASNGGWRPLHGGAVVAHGDVSADGSLSAGGSALVGAGGYHPQAALYVRDTSWWLGVAKAGDTPWADTDSFVFNTHGAGRPFVWTSGGLSTPLMLLDTAGRLGIGTTAPAAPLHVAGTAKVGTLDAAAVIGAHVRSTTSIQMGNDPATCDGGRAGSMRWTGTTIEVCDGTAWASLYTPPADGGSQGQAAPSCLAILEAGQSSGDGVYWIDPNGGSTSDAFQVYCDMTTDGGGWTLLLRVNGGNGLSNAGWSSAVWTGTSTIGDLPTSQSALAQASVFKSQAMLKLPLSQVLLRDETELAQRATRRTVWSSLKSPYTGAPLQSWLSQSILQSFKTCDHANRVDASSASGRWSLLQEGTSGVQDDASAWGLYVNHGNNGLQARLVAYNCKSSNQTEWAGFGSSVSGGCNLGGATQGGFSQRRDLANDSLIAARHTCPDSNVQPTVWTIWGRPASGGAGQESARTSCQAWLAAGESHGDGLYWIDPNGGSTADAFQAYCDMTSDGGGWTLLLRINGGSDRTSAGWSSGVWSGTAAIGGVPATKADLALQAVYRSPAMASLPVRKVILRDETDPSNRETRRTRWSTLKAPYVDTPMVTWFSQSVLSSFKTCSHANRVDTGSADGRWALLQESATGTLGDPTTWGLYVNHGNNGLMARLVPYNCQSSNQTEWAGFGSSVNGGCNLGGCTQGGFNQRRDLAFDSVAVARHVCNDGSAQPTVWTIWAREL